MWEIVTHNRYTCDQIIKLKLFQGDHKHRGKLRRKDLNLLKKNQRQKTINYSKKCAISCYERIKHATPKGNCSTKIKYNSRTVQGNFGLTNNYTNKILDF